MNASQYKTIGIHNTIYSYIPIYRITTATKSKPKKERRIIYIKDVFVQATKTLFFNTFGIFVFLFRFIRRYCGCYYCCCCRCYFCCLHFGVGILYFICMLFVAKRSSHASVCECSVYVYSCATLYVRCQKKNPKHFL